MRGLAPYGTIRALALVLLAACSEDAPPPAAPVTAPLHGASCADCHQHLVDAWNASPMAHALGWADPRELEGLAPVTDAAGFTYAFEVEGDRAYLVETPPGGEPLRAPLTLAIGAGKLDRSYAVVHGALRWFAPLERLSAPAHAALAPGNAMNPGSRAAVPITPECLGCHTDDPPPVGWPLNVAIEHDLAGSADTGAATRDRGTDGDAWTPRGLSCAACHGAADAHAAWQADELSGGAPADADPILRHRELGRFEQISVCAACHLQGDVRIVLDPDALGPPPPGGDVLAERAVFVAREPTSAVGFVSHVERLLLAPCFLASDMTCTTCHDPHRAIDADGVRARTRAACLDCHADVPAAHAGDAAPPVPVEGPPDCVACHMPRVPTYDLEDIAIHDHWIRARPEAPPQPDPLRHAASPGARWKRASWPGAPLPAHHDDPGLLMLALTKEGHLERARALVDVAAGERVRALAVYHHVRANLLDQLGRPEHARAAYERALELDPDYGPAATNLGILLGRLGDPAAGIAVLGRLIAAHPLASSALRNRAILRRTLGDVEGTVADLERALAIQPDATVAQALSDLYGQLGERERSAELAAESLRLDPRR